ncbi:MAG: tRNA threonylcarbamoyladenosine dehydratase [Clostridiales bacterium]|nr:tRNA threonylcarbamoyladenosine dehydratase [Clostridiales bacterium]
MNQQYERTIRIIGEEGLNKLRASRVLLFGVGGVGSYVCEGLSRAGIGALTLVDKDVVDVTNINRQIPALHSTVGKPKVAVMADRVRDIDPACKVDTKEMFFLPDKADDIDFASYDYVVDAVDTVTAKVYIIERAKQAGVPVISSMGTGNKLDGGAFRIADIEDTKVCPLAKVMRRELRKRGISGVKVLYSEEEPQAVGGSISFVPSVAGLLIAGEVVRELLEVKGK